jgi:hypothetical protein
MSAFKTFNFALKKLSDEITFSILHLNLPSTSTLTVPSGNLSICSIVPRVPILNKSLALGSSVEEFFWVSNTISLFSSITVSRALIDLSLPTNNGAIIFGKITISLRGKIG